MAASCLLALDLGNLPWGQSPFHVESQIVQRFITGPLHRSTLGEGLPVIFFSIHIEFL